MGKGSERNKLCDCGSGEKRKKCCDSEISHIHTAVLTGEDAEAFTAFFSTKTFLKPWVFRSPKYKSDNKEFCDVAIFIKGILILIEVTGSDFDPQNPQRYIKKIRKKHGQLITQQRIVENKSRTVIFKNAYFEFETNFEGVTNLHKLFMSTGRGEMEIAMGKKNLNLSNVDIKELNKYTSFYDPETKIHSFTGEELMFASKYIDTVKDFCWYLDFEDKFLKNDFSTEKKQAVVATVDSHREDLISIFLLNYAWDEDLNRYGKINLNKILGEEDRLKESDMVFYAGTDTREHLEEDDHYKEIMEERKDSYLWDSLVNNIVTQYEYAYKIENGSSEELLSGMEEMREIIQDMSLTSRFERVDYSRKIKESDEGGSPFRNMFSLAEGSNVLFSYLWFGYEKFPSREEQNRVAQNHAYAVWCRIKYAEVFSEIKDRVQRVLLITRHNYKNQSSYSFGLAPEMKVEEKYCRDIGLI